MPQAGIVGELGQRIADPLAPLVFGGQRVKHLIGDRAVEVGPDEPPAELADHDPPARAGDADELAQRPDRRATAATRPG